MTTESLNMNFIVTELTQKSQENAMKELLRQAVVALSTWYSFDSADAIQRLNIEDTKLIRKQMAKRGKSEKTADKVKKSEVPFPWDSSRVLLTGCQGLTYNHGLFTQCGGKPSESGIFCKSCIKDCEKNNSNVPSCGTVQMRLATDLMAFRDCKNRAPKPYMAVLQKLKISADVASAKAEELGLDIDLCHWEEPVEAKKSGRPKKAKAVVSSEEGTTSLFNSLAGQVEGEEGVANAEEKKRVKKTEEEKKAEEEEKKAKKAEKERLRADKKAKEALEKAEKEAKRAEEKRIRDEKKQKEEEEKANRKADREAKKAAKEAKKSAKSAPAPETSATPAPVNIEEAKNNALTALSAPEAPAKTTTTISAKRVTDKEGKSWIINKANFEIVDPVTKKAIGKFDDATKTATIYSTQEEIDEEDVSDSESESESENESETD